MAADGHEAVDAEGNEGEDEEEDDDDDGDDIIFLHFECAEVGGSGAIKMEGSCVLEMR